MDSLVLGFAAFLTEPDALHAKCRAFASRARQLGLHPHSNHGRNVVATSERPALARQRNAGWNVLHFDGLLHRRRMLAIEGVHPEADDREVVERLLLEHGADALSWLIGDWAFAAASSDELLLATDYFGNRALFYHVDDES